MYHVAASFEIPSERHQEFIDAALEDGRNSAANEQGTLRFVWASMCPVPRTSNLVA